MPDAGVIGAGAGVEFPRGDNCWDNVFSTIILWTHAVAGALWIGASACFVIAGVALEPQRVEQRNFVAKAAPIIERFGLAAAAVLFATGLVNFITVLIARRFALSAQFAIVLSVKVVIFIMMATMLSRAMRMGASIRALMSKDRTDTLPAAVNRMVRSHSAITAMGAVALVLGLWLMGTGTG